MEHHKPKTNLTARMEKRQKWHKERKNMSRVTRARTSSNVESTVEKQEQQTPSVSDRGFVSKLALPQNKLKAGKVLPKQSSAKRTDNKTGHIKKSKSGGSNNNKKVKNGATADDKKQGKSPISTPKKSKVEYVDAIEKLVNSTSVHMPKRYVLFVGNLPPDISKEQIEEHFKKTGGVKDVRLPKEKGTDKSKRFAYVEFNSTISHRIALRLHNTTLAGRKINVEFTSNGKRTDKRIEKLKQKNEKLAKFKMPFDT